MAQTTVSDHTVSLERIKELESSLEHERKKWREKEEHMKSENRKLMNENMRLEATVSAMTSRLERQKEFVVFPLIKLPEEVILDIATQLSQKHRRHLMLSCSTFRSLLYSKRAEHLDCRFPARIFGTFEEGDTRGSLEIDVWTPFESKRMTSCYYKCKVSFDNTETELPFGFVECIDEMEKNYAAKEISFTPLASTNKPFVECLVRIYSEATKYYPVVLIPLNLPVYFKDQREILDQLFSCTRSISLRTDFMSNRFWRSVGGRWIARKRAAVEEVLVDEATEIGITVYEDDEDSDREYEFCYDVTETEKTVTIYGQHDWE